MTILFYLLFLASGACLVVGVTAPETFTFLFNKKPKRSLVVVIFFTIFAVCYILFNIALFSSNQHSKIINVSSDFASPTISIVPTKAAKE